MEPSSLFISAGMGLLSSLLSKATEEVGKTIGEKIGEKTVEKSFWKKIKRVFVIDDDEEKFKAIENKTVASTTDLAMIEQKLKTHSENSPELVEEIKTALNINQYNERLVIAKLISIKTLRDDVIKLESQLIHAGIGTQGDYKIRISLQTDKMNYQIEQLSKILNED